MNKGRSYFCSHLTNLRCFQQTWVGLFIPLHEIKCTTHIYGKKVIFQQRDFRLLYKKNNIVLNFLYLWKKALLC